MAKKSQKNSKHVADLISSATLSALTLLAQVDKFAFLGVLDAAKPEHQARSELLECISSVKREDITIADQEAVRLLQLLRAYSTRWRTRFHADGGQCSSVMADSVPR